MLDYHLGRIDSKVLYLTYGGFYLFNEPLFISHWPIKQDYTMSNEDLDYQKDKCFRFNRAYYWRERRKELEREEQKRWEEEDLKEQLRFQELKEQLANEQ